MSVLRNALARLFSSGRRPDMHIDADVQTAIYMWPIIEKLLADGEDGDTYRAAVNFWRYAERPPVAVYDGEASFCRIDGPLQWAGDRRFPLGGLILSRGVTAHLDPFEANALHEHIRAAIERAIRAWIADHQHRDWPHVPVEFDRQYADRKAKAMISDWAARRSRKQPVAETDAGSSDHA